MALKKGNRAVSSIGEERHQTSLGDIQVVTKIFARQPHRSETHFTHHEADTEG